MKAPKVSIVIPAYNRAHYIGVTLRTALQQTYGDYEIVVVDDGSTDDTRAVVRSVAPTARYIYQENTGIPEVLNRCIQHARGEYIAFLGSDDALTPDALARQAAVLDAHPRVGIVHGPAWLIDAEGRLLSILKPPFARGAYVRSGREEIADLVMSNHIVAPTVMARRAAFEECGMFDPRFRVYEDWNMWTRILKRWDAGYVAEPLAYYRVHTGQAGSIFRTTHPRSLEANRRLQLEEMFADPEIGPGLAHLRRRAFAAHHHVIAVRALDEGYRWYGRIQALRAAAANPAAVRSVAGNLALIGKSFLPAALLRVVRRAPSHDRTKTQLRLSTNGVVQAEARR